MNKGRQKTQSLVSKAISDIENLKKSKKPSARSESITGDQETAGGTTRETMDNNSNQFPDGKLETGFGLPQTGLSDSNEMLRKEMLLSDRELGVQLRGEINAIQSKSLNSSLAIAIGILAIFCAALWYFHSDLKSTINAVELRVSKTMDDLKISLSENFKENSRMKNKKSK